MQDFAFELNSSPWRGIITEVGIGLEFTSQYMRVPGASKTIMAIECPYDNYGKPQNMRAVSFENAKRLAGENLGQAMRPIRNRQDVNTDTLFGLAITGAHYANRDSHAWVYLATPEWDAYMHFSIAANGDREWVGDRVSDRVQWFLNACLLSKDTWKSHIEDIGDSLETHNIDVLYAPGVGDFERMLLLKPGNPLAYYEGRFQRVADVVRDFDGRIYSGSFNPPTKAHLSITGYIHEISQVHCYKGGMSIEDMLHRTKMLDLHDRPILLTQCPMFVSKYAMLHKYLPTKDLKFILGADAWNKTIAVHQYPSDYWLAHEMPQADFVIMPREGYEIEENSVSKFLNFQVNQVATPEMSSTDVRNSEVPSEHEYLTPQVSDYIRRHRLYIVAGKYREDT